MNEEKGKLIQYLTIIMAAAAVLQGLFGHLLLRFGANDSLFSTVIAFSLIFDIFFTFLFFSKVFKENDALKQDMFSPLHSAALFAASVPLLLITMINILSAGNFISINTIISRGHVLTSYFSEVHPYTSLLFLLRIPVLILSILPLFDNEILQRMIKYFVFLIILPAVFVSSIIFISAPAIFPSVNKKGKLIPLISFELSEKRENLEDDVFTFLELEKDFGVKAVFKDGMNIYTASDYKDFDKSHALFEKKAVGFENFHVVISNKDLSLSISSFFIVFTLCVLPLSAALIFSMKLFFDKEVSQVIAKIKEGSENENYNLTIDTDAIEVSEMKQLAVIYNEKWLAHKYRETFLKEIVF